MKDVDKFERLYLLLCAFTFTESIIINLFTHIGMESLSNAISYWTLTITTVVAFFRLFSSKKNALLGALLIIILYSLVIYERHVDAYNTVAEYSSRFLTHGLGGILIGLSVTNYERFIKYLSCFSIVYVIVFLWEPINHSLLGLDEMVTGYMLSSLLIISILGYFTVFSKNRAVLILCIVSSLIITLFTSRGCGLSILTAWAALYLWDKKRNNFPVSKTIWRLSLLAVAFYFVFTFSLDYILKSSVSFETGSLLEKMSSGYANSSNGRDEIWAGALALINGNWMTGIGFGGDRIAGDFVFVHNVLIEIIIDFGLPIGLTLIILYWTYLLKAIRNNINHIISGILIALTIRTWVQLLFSSSYLDSMLVIMMIVSMSIRTVLNKNTNNEQSI